jgi:hypothetical protein
MTDPIAILLGPGGHTRPISETIVERVYITTSGMFTIPPFLNALTTFGADRIMYSVDYPYSGHAPAGHCSIWSPSLQRTVPKLRTATGIGC